MSKSLRIVNGDLTVGAGRAYETVSGAYKLAQDLRLWTLEKIGTDPAYPALGSRLDGGTVNGRQIDSLIGNPVTDELADDIREEVLAMLTQYQQIQLAKMKAETIRYNGRHTLTADEILHQVTRVETRLFGTTIVVRVTCRTLSGREFRLTIPVAV